MNAGSSGAAFACAGAVLAGGRSRRMGRPKAWLLGPSGRPLVAQALATLRAAGADPLLLGCGADPAPFAALARAEGARPVPDRFPGEGPLAGLEAVLDASPREWLLLVACDMPFLDAEALAGLVARAGRSPCAAVVPEAKGRLQPLHAVYHRRALAPLRAALEAGERRLTAAVEALELERVPLEGPSPVDVDTPAEARRAGLRPPRTS